jgi:hypothetical protein
MLEATRTCYVSQSCQGWKVMGRNGRTLARFPGRLAHLRDTRYVRTHR